MARVILNTISENSPSAASTTVAGATVVEGLMHAEALSIIATLRGATGGTLDVFLQTSWDGTTWYDLAHFPQLAAGAAVSTRVWHIARSFSQSTLTTIGTNLSPLLAANTVVGGVWGDRIRTVYTTGAGTSSGAAQVVALAQFCPRLR